MSFKNCNFQNENWKDAVIAFVGQACPPRWKGIQCMLQNVFVVWALAIRAPLELIFAQHYSDIWKGHFEKIELANFYASRLEVLATSVCRNSTNKFLLHLANVHERSLFTSMATHISAVCQRSERFIDFELFNKLRQISKVLACKIPRISEPYKLLRALVVPKASRPTHCKYRSQFTLKRKPFGSRPFFNGERWLGKLEFSRKILVISGFHFKLFNRLRPVDAIRRKSELHLYRNAFRTPGDLRW